MKAEKHTLLIVDDDEDQRLFMQRTFQSLAPNTEFTWPTAVMKPSLISKERANTRTASVMNSRPTSLRI
jgi:hypothetical protein